MAESPKEQPTLVQGRLFEKEDSSGSSPMSEITSRLKGVLEKKGQNGPVKPLQAKGVEETTGTESLAVRAATARFERAGQAWERASDLGVGNLEQLQKEIDDAKRELDRLLSDGK
ncbi:hypothetical protein HYS93_04865 [Candidatus Daviesbacteria bacterium]|nr:hypothetical protein [Candidatus Daviesbacteria bacterium]